MRFLCLCKAKMSNVLFISTSFCRLKIMVDNIVSNVRQAILCVTYYCSGNHAAKIVSNVHVQERDKYRRRTHKFILILLH